MMYCSISHFGPSIEEIQSLDEIINPGTQGLTGLVGMFLLGFRDRYIIFFVVIRIYFGGHWEHICELVLNFQGKITWQKDAIF